MVAQLDSAFLRARPRKAWPRLLAYALFEGRPLTTRGRWINPLVLGGHRLWAALPMLRPVPDPVFILGLGRSGTTILGTILALHRDVGYLNEPKALWHAALPDDDLIGSYSPTPGRYRMGPADATPKRIRRLHRAYRAFLRLSGARRVVDKYPELLFRTGFLEAAFPQARRIVMIRNGNDACQSIRNWSARNGSNEADWWGEGRRKWHLLVEELVAPDRFFAPALDEIRRFERQEDMAAVEWIATMREAGRLRGQRGDKALFVRYEELAARPRRTLSRILDYCNLAPDETMLRYGESVLRPPAPYPPAQLHPAIAPLFAATMTAMGYESAA